jgi:hypothetical protein
VSDIARRPRVLSIVCAAVLLTGCATISSTGDATSPGTTVPLASEQASDPRATTSKPSRKPRKTQAPPSNAEESATPTQLPSASPSDSGPNIAITGFVSITDRLLVDADSVGRVSLLNNGPLEVGQFYVGVTNISEDGLTQGFSSPVSVGGMVPGQALDVTVTLGVHETGNFTFTAAADTDNVLKESNEDDNTRALAISAVSLPNLAFAVDEFKITDTGSFPTGALDQNGQLVFNNYWEFTLVVVNTGSVASPPYSLRGYYYDAAGQVVDNVVPFDESIPPGGRAAREDFMESVGTGTPPDRVYLELDPGDDVEEFDETDNQASVIPVFEDQ